jgi:Glycosyltransferase (GlcNAc)
MEAMASGADHKIAVVFAVLMTMYAVITLSAMSQIESRDFGNNVLRTVTAVHSVATTRDTTASSTKGVILPTMVNVEDIHDIQTLQHTFPVHVGDDMEEIDHPGILMANKEKMKQILSLHSELPKDGKMRVPRFWHPVAYGEEGVRQFLGENGKRLITKEEALSIGSFHPVSGRETIYISVASYRDPECQPTVEDMFLRAEFPERLRVAVIDQRAENDSVPQCAVPTKPCSEDSSQTLCKYHHLIDRFEVPAHLSIGPVFARHLANRMYRGKCLMDVEVSL